MTENKFPAGWDEKRVRAVIDHYDNLSDEELAGEDDAAFEADGHTMMSVPNELVDEVRRLIAGQKKSA